MEAGSDQFPAIGVDTRGILQRSLDGHGIWQPVALKQPRNVKHGQTAGAIPRLHAHVGCVVPARAHGRTTFERQIVEGLISLSLPKSRFERTDDGIRSATTSPNRSIGRVQVK